MTGDWIKIIRGYFDEAAPNYAATMQPVFGPLAQGLIEIAEIQPGEAVLDVGTGTGAATRAAKQLTRFVVGLDVSRQMLVQARSSGNTDLIQGDLHELPLLTHSVDVVTASFALNSTDPGIALRELRRVICTNGRIIIQEWDSPDQLSELVSDTFALYAVDDATEGLLTFRQQMEMPIPWDDIESIDELINLITESNFRILYQRHETPSITFSSVKQFLQYKLAWPSRIRELEAMPPDSRDLCWSDLLENVDAFAEPEGSLIWKPNVFRVIASAV